MRCFEFFWLFNPWENFVHHFVEGVFLFAFALGNVGGLNFRNGFGDNFGRFFSDLSVCIFRNPRLLHIVFPIDARRCRLRCDKREPENFAGAV